MSNLQTLLNQIKTKVDQHDSILNSPSNTDAIINKWSELVSFLSGISDSSNLASILSGYISKSSDLINALTSTATDKALTAAQGKTLNDLITSLSSSILSQSTTLFITGNTSLSANTKFVHATITSPSQSLALYSSPYDGQRLDISIDKTSTSPLSLAGNGKTIEGIASYSLDKTTLDSTNFHSIISLIYQSSSTNWILI